MSAVLRPLVPAARLVVVVCAGVAILLLLALLPLDWASAPSPGATSFTGAVGSTRLGTSAVLVSAASLGLLVWLGLQRRALRVPALAAFGLSGLWLGVGLGSLLVLDQGVQPGPGLWLGIAVGLLAAGAGAGARLAVPAPLPGAAVHTPPPWSPADEWGIGATPTAPLRTTDPGDDW